MSYGLPSLVVLTPARQLFWSSVDINAALAPTNVGAGSFSTGRRYQFTRRVIITGIRVYYSYTGSDTIRLRVWDSSGTGQGSVDVSTTTNGIYTGTFSSAYTLPSSEVGKLITCSMWSTGGTRYGGGAVASYIAEPATPYVCGECCLLPVDNCYAGGNAMPVSAYRPEMYAVEPVWTPL